MTVTVRCDQRQGELLRKQLLKIVDVVDVRDETQDELIGGYTNGDRVLRTAR
jgi:acetolactate synthase small subunit